MIENINLLNSINLFLIIKISLEVFLFVYAIIAIVVIRQIKFMTKTIKSDANKYLFILAYLHLIAVFITIFITLTTL
ncbi:hypothetical protein CO178_00110 [candidate division WWE3 bacterium CG_4_9_14_3_um_filter_34_6]|uniref:Uncharacterized protein n=1 Tax=candidate division WWE3 bacterium CG_4_9_14_3_um_filter_34_6 TaxID=1975079 RepID=A0A2M7X629_UNCKA|nr:MAG: hypothetical protein CO178_00110 [candidate division WWE3 bacterium CG_4_9_14_3_um_filter_34_6]